MFIMSVTYVLYLVGPVSLVGCVIILLFYPIMVSKFFINNEFLPFNVYCLNKLPILLPTFSYRERLLF